MRPRIAVLAGGLLLATRAAPASAEPATPMSMEVHGLAVAQITSHIEPSVPPDALATIRRARALGVLHLWRPEDTLLAQAEFSVKPQLLDARADLGVSSWLRLDLGQQIVPFSRSWNTPLPLVATGERSSANNHLSPGRKIGGFAVMQPTSGLRLWTGIFDTANPNPAPDELVEHRPMGMARIQLDTADAHPYTDSPTLQGATRPGASVGAGLVAEGKGNPTNGGAGLRTTATVDAGAHAGGFAAMAEGFARWFPQQDAEWGGSVQLTQFVVPQRVQLVARGVLEDVAADPVAAGLTATLEGAIGVYAHGDTGLAQVVVRESVTAPRATEIVTRGQLRF